MARARIQSVAAIVAVAANPADAASAVTPGLHEQPGHLIRRAHQIAVSQFHEQLGREVTPIQYAVLRALQDQPGIDQATLARQIALDTSSTADVAIRLETKGLIGRDLLARGQRCLRLTAAGVAQLERLEPGMNDLSSSMLASMDRREREEFIRLLRKFVHLNDDGRSPPAAAPPGTN